MHLSDGRPENTEGRLEKEIRTYDLLDSLGVEYKRVDHFCIHHHILTYQQLLLY